MTDLNDDLLLSHAYDGIREYDNPLPGWWSWLWIFTIVFSACYAFYFHIGTGPSIHEQYQADVAHHIEILIGQLGDVRPDNPTLFSLMENEEWMNATKGMFVGNCAQCHAGDGGGNVGPNLADDYWKNVREPADIYRVITAGVPGSGMAAWEDRLSEPQRILLAAYVASLRGQPTAAPKEQEGNLIPPWTQEPETP